MRHGVALFVLESAEVNFGGAIGPLSVLLRKPLEISSPAWFRYLALLLSRYHRIINRRLVLAIATATHSSAD